MGKIRNGRQNFAQARFLFGRLFFGLLNLLAQFLRLLDLCRSILPAFLELGNLFGSPVAVRLQRFRCRDGLPALGVDGAKVLQNFRRIHAALPQFFFHQRKVVTNKIQIEHSALTLAEKRDSVHADSQSPDYRGRLSKYGLSSARRSEGSAFCGGLQILHFVRDDKLWLLRIEARVSACARAVSVSSPVN